MTELPITPIIPTSLSVSGIPLDELVVRFSDWIDVRDYGAVGDGVTDDTDAIQNAIDACQAGEGGVVLLSSGYYKITAPLTITQHHVTLMGPGPGIGFDPGGAGDKGAAVLLPSGAAAFTGSAVIRVGQSGTPTDALAGIVLRDFTIAGYSLASNASGIYAEMQQSQISGLRIENVTGDGMQFASVTAEGDGCFNDIFNNFIYQPDGIGINMGDAPDNRVTENTVIGCGSHAIEALTAGTCIQNNLLSATGKGVSADTYDTKVIGNRIQDCNGGVYLDDSATGFGGFQVVGNKIWNCSIATDNTTDSINVTAGGTMRGSGVISGNSFWTNAGGANGGSAGSYNRARYHINIASANVTEVAIGSNSYGFNSAVRSYGTAAINNDGTRTQIEPFVIAQSGAALSHTGDTNLHNFVTAKIPGGLMGKNGRVRVSSLWTMTNNANGKSLAVAFGSLSLFNRTLSSQSSAQVVSTVMNRASQSSQIAPPSNQFGPGETTNAVGTASIDTSADVDLKLETILANSSDTVTLESYSIEVLPG